MQQNQKTCKCKACQTSEGNACNQIALKGSAFCFDCRCRECEGSRIGFCGQEIRLCQKCWISKKKSNCPLCGKLKPKDSYKPEGELYARDCCLKCDVCLRSWVNEDMPCRRCAVSDWKLNENAFEYTYRLLKEYIVVDVCEIIIEFCLPTAVQTFFGAIASCQSNTYDSSDKSYLPRLGIRIIFAHGDQKKIVFSPDAKDAICELQSMHAFSFPKEKEVFICKEPSNLPLHRKNKNHSRETSTLPLNVVDVAFRYLSQHAVLWSGTPDNLPASWYTLFPSDFIWQPLWKQ